MTTVASRKATKKAARKKASRKVTAPPMPWWGDHGVAPHLRYPGVTIALPAVWVPLGKVKRVEAEDDEDEAATVWTTTRPPRRVPAWELAAGGRWQSPDGRYFFDMGAADDAVAFFPELLRHHIGEFSGQPFDLMEYQRVLLTRPIFGWKSSSTGLRRFRKVFAFIPKGAGKAIALDTPIATPCGWTTAGALREGDWVFDEAGETTRVVKAHDVLEGRPCYRVRFDDGASIVADAGHLWVTEQRYYGDNVKAREIARRHGAGSWKVRARETREIAATLRYSNGRYQSANHSIRLCGPLQLPEQPLPIEPYLLGVWLGNGDSDGGRITFGAADVDEMMRHLYAVGAYSGAKAPTNTAYRVGIEGLRTNLRTSSLLHNKHVPRAYLRANERQRKALLQGLMDTDGYINNRGACEFTSTTLAIADGCIELLWSLGVKATINEGTATLEGRVIGPKWLVRFQAPTSWPVFRLERKRAHQRVQHHRRALSADRRIVLCEPVPSVPVRCLTVDSPSQTFLVGRQMVPTHNSPWAAGTGLYLTVADGEDGAEVYALANDRDQARIVHTNAKIMVEQSEDLSEVLDVTKDSIVFAKRRSVYKVLASDATGAHGFRPHGAIFDEFHGQPNRDLYEAIKKSMVKRRQPLMLIVTHAGDDDEGICYEEYEGAKRVLSGTADEPTFLPVIFEASKDDDWTAQAVWARVNPGHGITVKTEGIELECKEAQNEPRKLNDFLRYHLNRWVNSAVAWIPSDWWDACAEPVVDDAALQLLPCAGGLDMAQKIDLAAFVLTFRHALERRPAELVEGDAPAEAVEVVTGDNAQKIRRSLNYRITVLPFFWIPEDTMREREREDGVPYSLWVKQGLITATEGNVIDYDRIVDDITTRILPRFPRLKGVEIGYDPAFATDIALRLQNHKGFNMVEVLQNYKHLSEPAYLFEGLIRSKRVAHGGHRVLRHHVENVLAKRDDAGRLRPVKARNTRKRIDGVVSTIMALSRLSVMPDEPKRSRLATRGALIIGSDGVARDAITGQEIT